MAPVPIYRNTVVLHINQMKEALEKGERDIEIDLAFHGLLVKMTKNNTLETTLVIITGII